MLINANDGAVTLYRDSTNLGHSDYGFYYCHVQANYTMATLNHMDSPSSTSELTYALYFRNVTGSSTITMGNETGKGNLIAMEIGA